MLAQAEVCYCDSLGPGENIGKQLHLSNTKSKIFPTLYHYKDSKTIVYIKKKTLTVVASNPGLYSNILLMGGGGVNRGSHILYPKKSQILNLSVPKISPLFLPYLKNPTWAVDLSWWKIQKIQASFICLPQKSLLTKILDPKKSFGDSRHQNMWVGSMGPHYKCICMYQHLFSRTRYYLNLEFLKYM